jgi:hypothetical protein
MGDPWLPNTSDYAAPSNEQQPARGDVLRHPSGQAPPRPADDASPPASDTANTPPDSELGEITPYPQPAPTVSGTLLSQSVYQGG